MLVDITTGTMQELSMAPDGMIYEDFQDMIIWSPDGKKIAVIAGEKHLCIVEIDIITQTCTQISEDDVLIRYIDWSPSGEEIAVLLTNYGQQHQSLFIYDVNDGNFIEIIDSLEGTSLDWIE